MSLYKQYGTDKEIEKTGVILKYANDDDPKKPIEIRIARAGGGNLAFQKRLDLEIKPFRRQIQTETLSKAKDREIMIRVYSATVILGWENVKDADGNDLPFNYENCIKLLTDLPDLFEDIVEQSHKVALFRSEIREADAKNSLTSSSID